MHLRGLWDAGLGGNVLCSLCSCFGRRLDRYFADQLWSERGDGYRGMTWLLVGLGCKESSDGSWQSSRVGACQPRCDTGLMGCM